MWRSTLCLTTPHSALSRNEVLCLFPALATWAAARTGRRAAGITGAIRILEWLAEFAGDTWQQRWQEAGADRDTGWIDRVMDQEPWGLETRRQAARQGLYWILLARVIRPDYAFFASMRSQRLLDYVRSSRRPELFRRLEDAANERGICERAMFDALNIIAKMVLHTGRDVDELQTADLLEFRAWILRETGTHKSGVHQAWDLLRHIGVFRTDLTLQAALREGPRPTTELVDRCHVQCQPVKALLIRYLDERRPSLDYNSFRALVRVLVKQFWRDIEIHQPGVDSLKLAPDVVAAWKMRTKFVAKEGQQQPRKHWWTVFFQVRAFYLDVQEWARDDPYWVAWASPSPIRRSDMAGYGKVRQRTAADMHQRVRERLPHLPTLVATVERHRDQRAAMLGAARATPRGERFVHDGVTYLRVLPTTARTAGQRQGGPDTALVENLDTRERFDAGHQEDAAFWTWAIIEVLRHTGVRIEELLEITHLALVSYRIPRTGELVPMLQILPSKANEERLLLVSPELASVLASIIKRHRDANNGVMPAVSRYDPQERVSGPPLPHLFQRKKGQRPMTITYSTVRNLLNDAIARSGLTNAAGDPLVCTPHDFRRMFATEAVTGGLPVHIAARILGHKHLTTTQAYLAVFHDDLVASYQAFLQRRRSVRPAAEYREPTSDEWREFQQHFELRRVELGVCGRPYGTACKHEHACIRCSMLRIEPTQRLRLIQIIRNLTDRISEARTYGWLGEVEGLQVSLAAAERKLVGLDRLQEPSQRGRVADLGLPVMRSDD